MGPCSSDSCEWRRAGRPCASAVRQKPARAALMRDGALQTKQQLVRSVCGRDMLLQAGCAFDSVACQFSHAVLEGEPDASQLVSRLCKEASHATGHVWLCIFCHACPAKMVRCGGQMVLSKRVWLLFALLCPDQKYMSVMLAAMMTCNRPAGSSTHVTTSKLFQFASLC